LVDVDTYNKIHEMSTKDVESFWSSVASELDWFKPWEKTLDGSNPPFYKWFVGGEHNASYLTADRL